MTHVGVAQGAAGVGAEPLPAVQADQATDGRVSHGPAPVAVEVDHDHLDGEGAADVGRAGRRRPPAELGRAAARGRWRSTTSKKWRAVAVLGGRGDHPAGGPGAARISASRVAVDLGALVVGHQHAGGQLGDLARHADEA